ncbi:MAG TPA: GNAT family N-acetyltransferase [Mycobacteriales bacterium]|nr:GNAT family N-acetyltransferase [Mycobacteriales bacterium]
MIRVMEERHVPRAASLLVGRHTRHREQSRLLVRLDEATAEAEVSALLALDGAAGWVAEHAGEVVGYLIANSHQPQWFGPNAFVQAAGWAGAHLRELYAEAAAQWHADGRLGHYVLAPASQVEPWFHLGFGVQHVHAAMPAVPRPADGRVRPASPADLPALPAVDRALDAVLQRSPVFSGISSESDEELLAGWEEALGKYAVFVAELDGAVVGAAIGGDVGPDSANAGIIKPQGAGFFAFAAVLPEARGLGLGRALGDTVVTWAVEAGHPTICTDWRSGNLGAARTWPSLGYEPTFLRLHRQLAD